MIVDTNVLLRASIDDDPKQSSQARDALAAAERIFISNTVLCEFVWVARKRYEEARDDIANCIRVLIADPRVVIDQESVGAGLDFLDRGGDFADGVIEYEGRRQGGRKFVTFDRKAASIIGNKGREYVLLGTE